MTISIPRFSIAPTLYKKSTLHVSHPSILLIRRIVLPSPLTALSKQVNCHLIRRSAVRPAQGTWSPVFAWRSRFFSHQTTSIGWHQMWRRVLDERPEDKVFICGPPCDLLSSISRIRRRLGWQKQSRRFSRRRRGCGVLLRSKESFRQRCCPHRQTCSRQCDRPTLRSA